MNENRPDWHPADEMSLDQLNAYVTEVEDKISALPPAERAAALAAGDARARAKGHKVGSLAEVLDLSPEDMTWIETRAALARALKSRRAASNLSQDELAARLKTVRNRVSRAESAQRNVSLDFLVRALVATGATKSDIAAALAPRQSDLALAEQENL